MPVKAKEGSVRPKTSTAPATNLEIKALVYTRAKWGAGAGWIAQPYMSVLRITDSANQQWGECVIRHDYGLMSRALDGHDKTRDHARFGQRRSWVRVDWLYPDGTREVGRFFGEIESLVDEEWNGVETLFCRDFRWTLSQIRFDEGFAMLTSGVAGFIGVSPGFNAPMVPTDARVAGNRSSAKQAVTVDGVPFSVYAIDNAATTAWDGRAIVDHLLMLIARKCKVLVKSDKPLVGADPLTFFKSVLDYEHRDAASVLHEIITGSGQAWTIEPIVAPGGPTGGDVLGVNIVVFAMHSDDQSIAGIGTIKGNANVVNLPQRAHWMRMRWRYINERCYDQVLVRGNRVRATRSACYSLAAGFPASIDAGLDRGWNASDEARFLIADVPSTEAHQFEEVYCRYAMSSSYNPCEAFKVGGNTENSEAFGIDPLKINHARGRRGCIRSGFIHNADYRAFASDNMANALPSTGHHIAGEMIAKDAGMNEFRRISPFRMLSDVIGVVATGGPSQHEDLADYINSMGITFGIELDYHLQAHDGDPSDFGYTRVLILEANDANLELVRNAMWSQKEDDAAALYVINGMAANDYDRLLKAARLRRYSAPYSRAGADLHTLVIKPELRVGYMLRAGATSSSTPIMSVSHDMVKGESHCQTERAYNA